MRVVQIKRQQPVAAPSLFRETITVFAVAAVAWAFYVVIGAAF